MALLQVRDFPQELYERLAAVARAQRRSMAQQTVTLMADALGCEESNALRRQALFSQVAEWGLEFRVDAPDPADLVREDRDR